MKRFLCSLVLVLAIMLATAVPVVATSGSRSYLYDDWGRSVPAPVAYTAGTAIDGNTIGCGPLLNPSDLFVSGDGTIYLVDTGNQRIVILDQAFALIRILDRVIGPDGETSFNGPSGIYVTSDGVIYLCDTENNRVLRFTQDGTLLGVLEKPVSELLETDVQFKPSRVVVDRTGTVYVVAQGIFQGMVAYDESGSFVGFHGSDRVEMTLQALAALFWKRIFTRDQGESMVRLIPVEYSSAYIDDRNFIYVTTSASRNSIDEIRKLNAIGTNVLYTDNSGRILPKNNFGDLELDWIKGRVVDNRFVDLHVDRQGRIALLDAERCRLFLYDRDLNLLFTVGAPGDMAGTFRQPVAIEQSGSDYLVLDGLKGTITVLQPTAYAQKVLEAAEYYAEGLYEESMGMWQEILKDNANLSLASRSIGKAYLQQGLYLEAMRYLQRGNDRQAYSRAFREYRKLLARSYLPYLVVFLVSILLVRWLVRRSRRTHRSPIIPRRPGSGGRLP